MYTLTLTDREKVKTSAEQLVEDYALEAPFNVSSIAESKGIDVLLTEDAELLGLAKKAEPKKAASLEFSNLIAYFNKKEKKLYLGKGELGTVERLRFTIAHELGHYILGHNNKFRVIRKEDIYDYNEKTKEIEANYFAGYLLVPDKDLKEKLKVLYPVFDGEMLVSKLAEFFVMSLAAMRIRLRTFRKDNPNWYSKALTR